VDGLDFACSTNDDCGGGWICAPVPGASTGQCVEMGGTLGGDLEVSMTSMSFHIGQRMEFRVVSDDGFLRALAVLDPLGGEAAAFEMPGSVPASGGVHFLDFFADVNGNGEYDGHPTDHSWRREIGAGPILFAHDTSFATLEEPTPIGGDFRLTVKNMRAFHGGQLFEARVVERLSGRTVGLYRLAEIPPPEGGEADEFVVLLPGIIDAGTAYQVDMYADKNKNGQYDAPELDHAWRVEQEADLEGNLDVEFTHNVDFVDVEF
jgi:hypothetical protein